MVARLQNESASDFSAQYEIMRCAKGISLSGFWEVRGFPFCDVKRGLRLPFAVGQGV